MARIINLKNRKVQPQKPRVEAAAFKPHQFARPRAQESSPLPLPSQPAEPEAPEPKAQAFSWSGPIYDYRPDMRVVVVLAIILFAIAALVQVFQKNIITTIFFGLLGVVILIRAGKRPEVVDFEINPLGVKAGERLYGFREIKSFWVEYEPTLGIKELSLQLRRWYSPYVKIPLYDQNPVQLRLVLLSFLPEVEHKDTLAETLSRKLGI